MWILSGGLGAIFRADSEIRYLYPNDIVYLARDERDNACEIFMQWFVNEQVEEEDNVGSVLAQLRLIKDSPQSLFIMDKDMAQRVFTPPLTGN